MMGHVGSAEQLDRVTLSESLSTESLGFDWDFDTEALEVHDDGENGNGRDEVHDVGRSLSPECLNTRALSFHATSKWESATIAPLNSGPRPVLTVIREKTFQTMNSKMLMAMKSWMPEPRP